MNRYVRRIGLDCEFIPNDLTMSGLLSLALIDEYGERLYIINSEADDAEAARNPFLREHVLPHIDRGTGDPEYAEQVHMRSLVQRFFERTPEDVRPTIYAWCGAQDLVRLHGLWNHNWSLMPRIVPHSFVDVDELIFRYGINEDDLPEQVESTKHHALWDAHHDLEIVRYIEGARAL